MYLISCIERSDIIKKYILAHSIEFLRAKNLFLLGRIIILIKIFLRLKIKKEYTTPFLFYLKFHMKNYLPK